MLGSKVEAVAKLYTMNSTVEAVAKLYMSNCLDSDHDGNALAQLRSQTSAVFRVRNSAEVSDFCRGKAAEWCLEHGRGLRTRL